VETAVHPLFLLNRDGDLLHSNEAGLEELEDEGCLRLAAGRLTPSDPVNRPRWIHALASADRRFGVSVRLMARFEDRVATIYRNYPEAGDPVAAQCALVIKLDRRLSEHCRAFANWCAVHGITPAESRTVLGLARGESAKQIANEAGVSVNTIRTQIRGAIGKTRSRSSLALVAAALRYV